MKKYGITQAILLYIGLVIVLPFTTSSQLATKEQENNLDKLYDGFVNPPNEAKPRTWWHWTGGNVSKEGITKDMEWMKRIGIGGFMMFDVSIGFGQQVSDKKVFFTRGWFDALKHAASEADRLGLEMTLHSSAGWSETGGPWVKPEEAVKKIVWSEKQTSGPQKLSVLLAQPPSVNGPIQNLKTRGNTDSENPDPTYYADFKVLAYRTPEAESKIMDYNFKVSSNFGSVDGSVITDNDLSTFLSLPVPTSDKSTWIQFEFEKPYKTNAFSLAFGLSGIYGSSSMRPGAVKISDDGDSWQTILTLPGAQHDVRAIPVRTYSIPETKARYFKIEFSPGSGISTVGGPDGGGSIFAPAPPPETFKVLEANFLSGGRVNRWEDKANFAAMFEFETLATPESADGVTIKVGEVIDVTSLMDTNGKLDWDVPDGNWTILRMGYSLTGAKNGPAVPAGTGFEVDKLNQENMAAYYKNYTGPIKEALGQFYGKNLKYFLVDSYEANAQNWTSDMIEEFTKRRAYDPTPYLPVLAGRIVESSEVSDRFLWDFRRTIADLLADEHYYTITELAHADGIKIYSEAAGISLPIIQDALLNKSKVDIPMGEFSMTQGLSSSASKWIAPFDLESLHSWRGANDRLNAHQADIREAASASHIYGKKFVGAESWTGGSYETPATLKNIGDYWNTQGVNRFIFHTSAHQPLDTKPGNTMVGTHIHRNITWAEQAAPFMTYLARNSYLLQQGKFVADVIYFLGESIPSSVPYWKELNPEPPDGYDYDFMNTEILLGKTTVEKGLITLESGMQYRVLVLPETKQITPRVLKKIRELVTAGAVVVGPKPEKSSGLVNYPDADREVSLLANEIWGGIDGKLIYQHSYGKGKVYWGPSLSGILADLNVPKDFEYNKPHFNTHLSWIHRRTENAEIYFITNMRNQKENVNIRLRVYGKLPEVWHSDNGLKEAVSYEINDSLTTVKLEMNPNESVFVVFKEPTQQLSLELPENRSKILTEIKGPWRVTFPPGLGAPEVVKMAELKSWTENNNNGIKYFSGTATYTNNINVPASWLDKNERNLVLDLGEVKDIAEIVVNDELIGTLWKAPYEINISKWLKKGINTLSIKVTNQWSNRILGDRKLPKENKILSESEFALFNNTKAELESSGLIGPVILLIKN